MVTLTFRHNRRSPDLLSLAAGAAMLLGVLAGLALIHILGAAEDSHGLFHEWFDTHPQEAVYILFTSIPVLMIIPVYFVHRWWRREDQEARLTLYDDRALLFYKGQEIPIPKGELTLQMRTGFLFNTIILRIPHRRISLAPSMLEKDVKMRERSLYRAMERLLYYHKVRKGEIADSFSEQFYGLTILFGITTPEIFDSSPYYVDYSSCTELPEMPHLPCFVRERANPAHVVGEVALDGVQLASSNMCEATLRKRAIMAIVELDEQIEP